MGLLEDALAIPDQLEDALWRVDSARIQREDSAGLLVCGMGGSAIGGELAAAALGTRLSRPVVSVRGYQLPGWVDQDWTVLCSSYSGRTEETLACSAAAAALGARRIVVSTGGELVDAARAAGDPVIGLPGTLVPRAAVAYMFVAAAEAAALAGAAPRVRDEIEAAAAFLRDGAATLRRRAAELAGQLQDATVVVYGAGLTSPAARRWKTQLNENAKLPAFFSELPEADHNEICGWAGLSAAVAVLVEDPMQTARLRRRFELSGEAIAGAGARLVGVEAEGETPTARLLWAVMLGDLVSLALAEARGVDPMAIEAIDSLKSALAGS